MTSNYLFTVVYGICYTNYIIGYLLSIYYLLYHGIWYIFVIPKIIGREFHRSDCTGGEPALVSLRIITLARRVGGGIPTLLFMVIFEYIIWYMTCKIYLVSLRIIPLEYLDHEHEDKRDGDDDDNTQQCPTGPLNLCLHGLVSQWMYIMEHLKLFEPCTRSTWLYIMEQLLDVISCYLSFCIFQQSCTYTFIWNAVKIYL